MRDANDTAITIHYLGFTYRELDTFLFGGTVSETTQNAIERMHARSQHKRDPVRIYKE